MPLFSALPSRRANSPTIARLLPRCTAPEQKVWVLGRDLPHQLVSKKLAPRYVGPYEVERMIKTAAVHLKLPAALKIHPTFHVSRVKLVQESELRTELRNQNCRSGSSW